MFHGEGVREKTQRTARSFVRYHMIACRFWIVLTFSSLWKVRIILRAW